MSDRAARLDPILASLDEVALGYPKAARQGNAAMKHTQHTALAATRTRTTRRAATAIAALLVLAAAPAEDVRAQRADGTPASIKETLQSLGTAAEQLQRASATARERREQIEALKPDTARLGKNAARAVSQWPAAQKADPAWDWARVLVFLVQTALVAQGHDPGRPDGLMGPNTMLALIAWSAVGGPLVNGKNEMSYLRGIDGNVAHLLHGTLKTLGLSPGPKNELLGQESVTALDRWDGTFRRGAMFIDIDEETGKQIVMNEFGAAGPSDTGEAVGRSSRGETTDRPRGTGQANPDCVKFSWHEKSPFCDKYVAGEGNCKWALNAHNTCGYEVLVYFLGNFGVRPSPSEERDWRKKMWWEEHMIIGENWAVSTPTGSEGRWILPEGVRLDVSYCVNRHAAHIGRGPRLWDWYRNEEGVGAVNTECLSDE